MKYWTLLLVMLSFGSGCGSSKAEPKPDDISYADLVTPGRYVAYREQLGTKGDIRCKANDAIDIPGGGNVCLCFHPSGLVVEPIKEDLSDSQLKCECDSGVVKVKMTLFCWKR